LSSNEWLPPANHHQRFLLETKKLICHLIEKFGCSDDSEKKFPMKTVSAMTSALFCRPCQLPEIRVTRLGEFSPIGWLLTLSFFANDRNSANSSTTFPQCTSYAFILLKWVGLHFEGLVRKRIWSPCLKS
jgi:hypothetical protein